MVIHYIRDRIHAMRSRFDERQNRSVNAIIDRRFKLKLNFTDSLSYVLGG
jgi:hypothetical protein